MDRLQNRELPEILKKTCQQIQALGVNHVNQKQIVQKIINLGRQLQQNNNKQSDYCKREQQKDKSILFYNKYHTSKLQELDVQADPQCYWARQISKQSNIVYTYLKMGYRIFMFNSAFIIKNNSSTNSKQEHKQGYDINYQITFILSQAPIQHILTYVQLCLQLNTVVPCIMPTQLWSRVQGVIETIWGQCGMQLLKNGHISLCESQKPMTFYYRGSSILFYRNLWKWDSYSVYVTLKGSKYQVKGAGIQNSEVIYGAWRKGVISEIEYCRLVDKATKQGVVWGDKDSQPLYRVIGEYQYYLSPAELVYITYASCQVFIGLPKQIIGELYASGEIKQYARQNTIHNSSMKLDKFYIVLEGLIEVVSSPQSMLHSHLKPSQVFTIYSLINDSHIDNATLKVRSTNALVFSIDVWKAKYILSHYTEYLKRVSQSKIQQELQNKLVQMGISNWMQRMIKIDANNSLGLSEDLTKQLNLSSLKLKISNKLWHILCKKNLRFLLLTK